MLFQNIKKNIVFLKYSIVWVSSTIVDMLSLYIFVDILNINLYLSVVISFLLAVINWFLLNKIWTFDDKSKKYKRQFVKFLIVSIIWLCLSLSFMYIFVDVLDIYYLLSKALTSIIVLFWNYFWNKTWTFSSNNSKIKIKTKKCFDIKYSIIIPAYNEEKRIVDTLKNVVSFFDKKKEKYEIIVVNDWSSDNTVWVVKNFDKNIKIIENAKNMGKWFSIKNWIFHAEWEYILFIDADNSTPIDNFTKLEKYLDKYDIIIWSRHLKESEILKKQPIYRRIIWRLWNKLINLLLIKGIKDTQCWFKLFKYNSAIEIFSIQKINRFWFDIEVLFISKIKGYTIKEVPVSWSNDEWSRFNTIKDSLKTLIELLYIKLNYWLDLYK
jgi:dolichyl-phosphate beta-glucosyltransferase